MEANADATTHSKLRGERGQTMVEMCVVLTAVTVSTAAVFAAWSSAIGTALQRVVAVITG